MFYIIVIGGGCFLILHLNSLKSIESSPLLHAANIYNWSLVVLTAGLSAAFVVVYAFLAYVFTKPKDMEHIHDLGDRVYYLGFIFTLWSLMSTIAFGLDTTSALKETEEFKQIINSFGTSLSTTIVGLVSRIILYALAENAYAYPDPNITFIKTATAFTNKMDELTQSFEGGKTVVNDAFGSIAQSLKDELDKISVDKDILNQKLNSINVDPNIISSKLNSIIVNPNVVNEKIGGAATDVAEKIRDVGKRYEALQKETDKVLAENVKRHAELKQGLESFVETSTSQFNQAITSYTQKIGQINFDPNIINQVASSGAEQLRTVLGGVVENYKSVNQELSTVVIGMNKEYQTLQHTMDSMKTSLQDFDGGIADNTQDLKLLDEAVVLSRQRFNGFSAQLQQISDHSQVMSIQLDDRTRLIDEALSNLEKSEQRATLLQNNINEMQEDWKNLHDLFISELNQRYEKYSRFSKLLRRMPIVRHFFRK